MFRRRAEDIFKIIDKVCKGFFKFAFVFLSEIYPNNIIFHINIPPMLRIILILIIPHKGNYVKKILIILYRFYVTGTVLTSVLQSVTGTECYRDRPCFRVLRGQSCLSIWLCASGTVLSAYTCFSVTGVTGTVPVLPVLHFTGTVLPVWGTDPDKSL